jgi:hypothetical protein
MILILGLAGTALAWASPNLSALCAEDENTYAWRVTFPQDEPNFEMELLWDSSTTPFDTIDFGADAHLNGPHDFTTPRGGTVLKIRYADDTGAKDTATANAELCEPPASIPEESIPEQSIPEQSIPEQSIPEQSIPQESEPEGSVAGGTGTPNASIPDTAAAPATGTAVGTLLFGVLLLLSLGSLAYANVRAGRR